MSQPPGPPAWSGPPPDWQPPPGPPPPPGWQPPPSQPYPPGSPGWRPPEPPRRRTPVLALLIAALVAVAIGSIALTTFLFIRPSGLWPGRAPTTGPVSSPTPDLGPLGRDLTAAGFACTVELVDPLIGGCYARTTSGSSFASRSLRWQGPGDQPTGLAAYVLSTDEGFAFPDELDALLAHVVSSGIWTADDRAAVRAEAALADGQQTIVETGWGPVTLDRTGVSLLLTGHRTGDTVVAVTPKTFPTAMETLEQTATARGYRCERTTYGGGEESRCTTATDDGTITIAEEDAEVGSLYGQFADPDRQSAFLEVVRVASPDDGAALIEVVNEAVAGPPLTYRAHNGYLVLCTRRDAISCSVYGVAWEP